jgi:hypothetical protein
LKAVIGFPDQVRNIRLNKIQPEFIDFCIPEIEQLIGEIDQPVGIFFHGL